MPNYGENLSVQSMVAVAKEAESLGFDSIWATDHLLMPRGSGTPYERIYESLTSLSYLAGVTSGIRLGTSALIVAMRNPVVAAKQIATIDALSGGRMVLALGTGWNAKEFSSLGSDFGDRGARVDETIRLLRDLFEGITSFSGSRTGIEFRDAVFDPRPSHKIPIWIGGTSPAAMKRASTLGDAWHPNMSPLDEFSRLVSQFRRLPGAERKEVHVRIGVDSKSTSGEYRGAQGDRRICLSADRSMNSRIRSTLEELRITGVVASTSPTGKTPLEDQIQALRLVKDSFGQG